jgi:hypothetical protein
MYINAIITKKEKEKKEKKKKKKCVINTERKTIL